jgi:hypothetical protein
MTNLELAKFRGEFLGLKVLLVACLTEIAVRRDDPIAYLNHLRDQSVREIAAAAPLDVRRQHMVDFREAASRIIAEATSAAGLE